MPPAILRWASAALALWIAAVFLYSFVDESVCAIGCGNLMGPVFRLARESLGIWGTRVVLLGTFGLFAAGAFVKRE